MSRLLVASTLAAAALIPILAIADVGPPAHLQVTEKEPGLYAVQWRVPKVLPVRAVPTPVLPEGCRPSGERTVTDQQVAWLLASDFRCDKSLAGQPLGMRYPFPDFALTTVIRVDLLSGDRFAHVLEVGEADWRLPEGTAAPDLVAGAKRAVAAGADHALGSWVHLALVVVLALFGAASQTLRLVSAFTLGQIGAAVAAAVLGIGLGAAPAEIGLALGVALLAREALRPVDERRSLIGVAAAAGVVHGLGIAALLSERLGETATAAASQMLAILGMDAVHLVGALGLGAVLARLARRAPGTTRHKGIAYAAGAAGMALAFGIAVSGGVAQAGAVRSPLLPGQSLAGAASAGTPGSSRLAPAAPSAPVQSFLAIEPFEVRHEVMLRVGELTDLLGLDPLVTLEVAEQPAVASRLTDYVLRSSSVEVDGAAAAPLLRRADFMAVDPTGALPRTNPVPEPVPTAVIGIVVAYPVTGMPETVSLRWDSIPPVGIVPATVIDPEAVASIALSPSQPAITWVNQLLDDPIPTVEAVQIEPVRVPVPLLSLPLFVLSGLLLIVGLRGRRRELSFAGSRVVLALAFIVGPVVQTAVAVPGLAGRTPSERQARRILSGMLPNIYRALEFRDEATIYDRLAVSVTGETLSDVYLEQRRALEVEERGGAQARVEAVEVLEATDIRSADAGFDVRAVWTVGGMVTHFGHRHFRQNRYDARLGIVPVEGAWKIGSIEVLEQERVK